MQGMVFKVPGQPLSLEEVPMPRVNSGQVLVKIRACAVCRTDLHVVKSELTEPKLPLIPGHEIVGNVVAVGAGAERFQVGDRVGIPWLGWTCGECRFCLSGRENLCDAARFTGYTLDGGYAEYAAADERFCFPVAASYSDVEAAPLLCAGLIGYRSLVKTGDARRLGLYGFGAAAHIVAQVAIFQGREIYAFTRPGDEEARRFATRMGARWAGDSTQHPPVELEAAILFAPVGELVPLALKAVCKGGRVVCGGIHMSDIPSFPYHLLWGERLLCSVANMTRKDGEEFMRIAPQVPVKTKTEVFALEEANQALQRLESGQLEGAAVLVPG
ncbi:MAG: zinc-dependent alcohol dehydrogenase family protein [Acidobacteriota bacterium]